MNNVKRKFSIRDLENLSGIKAHTIRIWEKRYNLLSPERTNTNIRTYSTEGLKKLLNITMLYRNGYKISKIASLSDPDIPSVVKEIAGKNSLKNYAINNFKLAMINFDQPLFLSTYNGLLAKQSFSDIFNEVFTPLLNELGLLWQTNTIFPAHQHFISGQIIQKIHAQTEKVLELRPRDKNKIFVPFLPENEFHEIGLLYINYELVLRGYKSIYLGQTTPMKNLIEIMRRYENVHFISYFTVAPMKEHLPKYIKRFHKMVMEHNQTSKLWLLGEQVSHLDSDKLPKNVRSFQGIQAMVTELERQTT